MRPRIAVIDYGVVNLGSLCRAIEHMCEIVVTEEQEKRKDADAITLPGVGAFAAGMEGLRVRGLIEPLREEARKSKPILGVCLGAQLLLEKSDEFGIHDGLGILKGEVMHFPQLPPDVEIPAIGWQEVMPQDERAQKLFAGVAKPYMYFVHSYIIKPADESQILARTSYGGYTYCAVVGTGAIIGTQFHPEKSGHAGQTFLKNYIARIMR